MSKPSAFFQIHGNSPENLSDLLGPRTKEGRHRPFEKFASSTVASNLILGQARAMKSFFSGVALAIALLSAACTTKNPNAMSPDAEVGETEADASDALSFASLTSLEILDAVLEPVFVPDVYSYTAKLSLLNTSSVIHFAASAETEVLVNGEPASLADGEVVLEVGIDAEEVEILVRSTSKDEETRYTIEVERSRLEQVAFAKASNNTMDSEFGESLAVSGDRIVVGAPQHESKRGIAYVWHRDGGTWVEEAILQNPSPSERSLFGASVDIDGDVLVVGAPAHNALKGRAYVYTRSGNVWALRDVLVGANLDEGDRFGAVVAVHGDTIAVGAMFDDSFYTGTSGPPAGSSNNTVANSGAVYLFERNGVTWEHHTFVKAPTAKSNARFAVSLDLHGDVLAVGADVDGAMYQGAIHVYEREAGVWSPTASVQASSVQPNIMFGGAVAVGSTFIVVGASFEASNGSSPSDNSAFGSGAAYVFAKVGGQWIEEAYLKASNSDEEDYFGTSVSVSGDLIAVGAPMEDGAAGGLELGGTAQANNGVGSSGAAYLFARGDQGWSMARYVKASLPKAQNLLGAAVALDQGLLVCGAPGQSSNATGTGGDESNHNANNSGAIYVIE